MAGLLCYESENQERKTDLDGVYWPCPIRCSSSESPGLYIVGENALEKETRLRGMMYNTAHSHGNTIKETNHHSNYSTDTSECLFERKQKLQPFG